MTKLTILLFSLQIFFNCSADLIVKVVQAAGQNQLTCSSYLFQGPKKKKIHKNNNKKKQKTKNPNPQDLNAALFCLLTRNIYLHQILPHFKILLDKINFYTYISLCWK